MSSTIVVWPIIKALCVAAQFVGCDSSQWMAVNEIQQSFLQQQFASRSGLSMFEDSEMRAWASHDYQELNGILEEEGFAIKLDSFPPTGFGVVAILDAMVEWLYEGEKTTIVTDTQEKVVSYPAVRMEDGFEVFQSNEHPEPIISVATKSGDTVWMTIAEQNPVKDFELLKLIKKIQASCVQSDMSYDSITFPMVDLDQEVDIAWLLGMKLNDWIIAQAKQQTKFKMNEIGARVKSAVAIGMCKSCGPRNVRHVIVDQPFYLWVERPGVSEPIFAGYITQEHWKDPQSLIV